MATATLNPPNVITRSLRETVLAAPLKVDRDAGVIYGVKIVGRTSPNAHSVPGARETRYTREALESAIPLYEDIDVKIDHRDRNEPVGDRPVDCKFGKLRNVHITESGELRGDLHYLRSHPLAERVLEDVERGLGVFGLSHDAQGQGRVEGGVFLIESITTVRSVDLVDNPATNRNLWESREEGKKVKTIKFRDLLESQIRRLSKPRRRVLRQLLEMDYMDSPEEKPVDVIEEDGDMPADPPMNLGDTEVPMGDEGAGMDADAALKEGFRTAIIAVVDDDTMDAASKISRIKTLLQTHDKLTAADEPAEVSAPVDEGDEEGGGKSYEDEDDESKEGEMKESLSPETREKLAKLARLEAVEETRKLASSMRVNVPAALLESIAYAPTAEARRDALNAYQAATVQPKSSGPGTKVNTLESKNGDGAAVSDEEFKSRVIVRK